MKVSVETNIKKPKSYKVLSETEIKAIKNWIKNTVVKELAESAISKGIYIPEIARQCEISEEEVKNILE